jgi:hypothetical protein
VEIRKVSYIINLYIVFVTHKILFLIVEEQVSSESKFPEAGVAGAALWSAPIMDSLRMVVLYVHSSMSSIKLNSASQRVSFARWNSK